jgi:hypothetical protein
LISIEGMAGDRPAALEWAQKPVRFREDIFPLLKARCFDCHSGRDSSSGSRLDRREDLFGRTDGKPLVKISHSAESPLIARVTTGDAEQRMPLDGEPLKAADIGLLRVWISNPSCLASAKLSTFPLGGSLDFRNYYTVPCNNGFVSEGL